MGLHGLSTERISINQSGLNCVALHCARQSMSCPSRSGNGSSRDVQDGREERESAIL